MNLLNGSKVKVEGGFNIGVANFKVIYEKNISLLEEQLGKNDSDILDLKQSYDKGDGYEILGQKYVLVLEKYIEKANKVREELLLKLKDNKDLTKEEWKNIIVDVNKITKNTYLNTLKLDDLIKELNFCKKEIFVKNNISDDVLERLIKLVGFVGASEFLFIYDYNKYSIISIDGMLLTYLDLKSKDDEYKDKMLKLKDELSKINDEKKKNKYSAKNYYEALKVMEELKNIYKVDNYSELNFFIWVDYNKIKTNETKEK